MHSTADLHCHSKYSDRPSEWFLRQLGTPESFTEPRDIYRICRQRGMDFVTISDHNCIAGALEIADLPGTFLSSEITVTFPEDGCAIHCLVTGITEEQFRTIDSIRSDIYEFQKYLVAEDILYSVAHPLFQVNDQMTVDHVEKLLLLFNRFEAINGTRAPRAGEIVDAIFRNLTPAAIDQMQLRQGIEPLGPEPWKKTFTAGSDDHGGVFLASAYTRTPKAATVEQFLAHLRAGNHEACGTHGSSLRLAHSFVAIGREYFQHRFGKTDASNAELIDWLLGKFLDGGEVARRSPWAATLQSAGRLLNLGPARNFNGLETPLLEELAAIFRRDRRATKPLAAPAAEPGVEVLPEHHSFHVISHVSRELSARCLDELAGCFAEGRFLECFRAMPLAATTAFTMAPVLGSFRTQHKDEVFLQGVASHFPQARHLKRRSKRKLWVTDTFTDVNGVAKTIEELGRVAQRRGRELTVMTCLEKTPRTDVKLKNFAPIKQFPLPEYSDQLLSLPPLLDVLEYIERESFAEVIVSTPGPVGLVARLAGYFLGLPVSGIYHTDFPLYARHLTGDNKLEQATWRYMRWFYSAMRTVYVPSNFYHRHLTENGFDSANLRVMPRGIDVAHFHPRRRQPDFWKRQGLPPGFQFLYVGRVSKEKNLQLLLDAFAQFTQRGVEANLGVVGDGPLLAQLRAENSHPRVAFTGFLRGEDLAAAYASSDVFVFPSTTDTFGNVVLEAQASGLPAIVSDKGGPSEIVGQRNSGKIIDVARPGALTSAMFELMTDSALRHDLRKRALENASHRSWDSIFDIVWGDTDQGEADQVEPVTA